MASQIKRVVQQDMFCGPAVLEMLYSFYGVHYSQNEIASATGLPLKEILQSGCSVLSLSKAVKDLSGDYSLWVRYNSTLEDLTTVVGQIGLPVGIEWRCTFREPDGFIWEEGHYSVVSCVDPENEQLCVIDPFNGENISHNKGWISFPDFMHRWWDENMFPQLDDATQYQQIFTQGLMFVLIAEDDVPIIQGLGFEEMTASLPHRYPSHRREIIYPTRPARLAFVA